MNTATGRNFFMRTVAGALAPGAGVLTGDAVEEGPEAFAEADRNLPLNTDADGSVLRRGSSRRVYRRQTPASGAL